MQGIENFGSNTLSTSKLSIQWGKMYPIGVGSENKGLALGPNFPLRSMPLVVEVKNTVPSSMNCGTHITGAYRR
ncbi:MAG: hypothetical protein Ct9H300mP11_21200 [Chloroflexota bacterium]|nr:MAG: hypothetical protein Ct9H300mP11_21200 [Chloroflexota bacterium]